MWWVLALTSSHLLDKVRNKKQIMSKNILGIGQCYKDFKLCCPREGNSATLGGGMGMDLSEQMIMNRGLNKDLQGRAF